MVCDQVQEIQGLYGPFTLTERVLQKIWLRQAFETRGLRTRSGKFLEVLDPGKWNLLGGPDFKAASIRLDGHVLRGDVEVHFNASDWYAHQHETNPEFNHVILHVLLYEDALGAPAVQTLNGSVPDSLALMPLLDRDLESIAMDEALLEMERVNELEWVAEFLELPVAERLERLRHEADSRWQQKCHYASKRLEAVGWSEACHQACLEVLGYARNRAPMATLALHYPLAAMRGQSAERLYASRTGEWKLSGLRPANHPLKRLQQYLQVLEVVPDWPERFESAVRRLPPPRDGIETSALRREAGLSKWLEQLREQIFCQQLGATRLNTLMVDALLPLAEVAGCLDAQAYWQHWQVGDAPDALRRFLKLVEATSPAQPNTNGLTQGALSLFYLGRL